MQRVVILGAGFGGLFAAQGLARAAAEITVVDRHNYHLFQPLLYQVATAGLAPSDVAWPIRSILSRQRNAKVLLDEVTGIDLDRREVILAGGRLPFDTLVVATGSTHSYFGHEEWAALAPGLKSVDDATLIRRRILTAFEQAEMEPDPQRRERLLRFVIVGDTGRRRGRFGKEASTIACPSNRVLPHAPPVRTGRWRRTREGLRGVVDPRCEPRDALPPRHFAVCDHWKATCPTREQDGPGGEDDIGLPIPDHSIQAGRKLMVHDRPRVERVDDTDVASTHEGKRAQGVQRPPTGNPLPVKVERRQDGVPT